MGSLYTATSVSSYNSNPPSDDGSVSPSNQVTWATQKSKLTDPLKTAYDTSETNTAAAFAKVVGGAGITSTAVNYTVATADQSKFVKATASGITITTPDATSVNSPFVCFITNESSGDITLAGNNPGVQQTVDGANSITIPSGCGVVINTDGSNWFTGGQNFSKTQIQPQGRLTLVSATPVMSVDETAKTAVYYTPYTGDLIPIPNGSVFSVKEFSELTLTLNSTNYVASSIYDVFVAINPADNSTIIIGTGPAWSTSTAGSGSRGSGAGTTEIGRLKGLWVNNNAITLRNNTTTYSIATKSAVYVGSIYIDGTNGQVSCHLSYGQSRKYGIWNAYNRVPVYLKGGDPSVSWNYTTTISTRPANNNTANSMSIFTGLAEEVADITLIQRIKFNPGIASTGMSATASIGYNSTSATSGMQIFLDMNMNTTGFPPSMGTARYITIPAIGVNTVTALESASPNGQTMTFFAQESGMLLSAVYRA